MLYSVLRPLLLVSALGLTTIAPSLFSPDVSGAWKVNFNNEAATETVMITFIQTDSLLTGHYLGYFDAARLAGSMNGKEIVFSYNIGGTVVNHYGKLEGNRITGSYHAGVFEQGDFTAVRMKQP